MKNLKQNKERKKQSNFYCLLLNGYIKKLKNIANMLAFF